MLLFLFNEPVLGESRVKIIINKKVNKLAYLNDGEVVRVFPVATGRIAALTPEGNFEVVRKIVNPYYSKQKIAGGSPKNPLGVRWLGLNACNTPGNTYGIHGTNNPKSIGKYASGGCIRMNNKDVIWLYQNTALHTPVEIINKEWDLEQKPVTIYINGQKFPAAGTAKPFMIDNRVMVSCRLLAEAAGCTVSWNNPERQIIATGGGITIKATVGRREMSVNNGIKYLEVPLTLRNNTAYIPVRALAEALGYTVTWDQRNFAVSLTGPTGEQAGGEQAGGEQAGGEQAARKQAGGAQPEKREALRGHSLCQLSCWYYFGS